MERKYRQTILLIFLILILLSINYPYLNGMVEKSLSTDRIANVTRVIDGDTIVIDSGEHVRLLGINTPETKEEYHDEAKSLLEEKILGKEIRLVFGKDKLDRYKRLLAYVYVGRENINQEMIESGFANYYFPSGKDKYYEGFKSSWEGCISKEINLCEKSEDICSNCIELTNFGYINEILVFHNSCSFDCDLTGWDIKDEGRKHFTFPDFSLGRGRDVEVKVGEGTDTKNELFWHGEDYVWTDTGDTMFLRDNEGKLVLWSGY